MASALSVGDLGVASPFAWLSHISDEEMVFWWLPLPGAKSSRVSARTGWFSVSSLSTTVSLV